MLAIFLSLLARLFSFALGRGFGRGTGAVVEGQCRVAAADLSAGSILAEFFITISHCAWRHFISLSNGDKETKQRKRLPTICIKCPQRADHCFWFPRSTVLAKPRTLETLLLANPYIPTLRHQCSRAKPFAYELVRPHPCLRLTDVIRCAGISGTVVRASRGAFHISDVPALKRNARRAHPFSPKSSRGSRGPITRKTREAP